jgi:hypothetical protein
MSAPSATADLGENDRRMQWVQASLVRLPLRSPDRQTRKPRTAGASGEFEQQSSEIGGAVAGDHVGGRDLSVPPGWRCLGHLGC